MKCAGTEPDERDHNHQRQAAESAVSFPAPQSKCGSRGNEERNVAPRIDRFSPEGRPGALAIEVDRRGPHHAAGPDQRPGPLLRAARGAYFLSMPALSITSFHFLISPVSLAIISPGELACATTPTLANCSLTSGMSSTSRIALFIVAMTSFGVPFGAPTAFHEITSKPFTPA